MLVFNTVTNGCGCHLDELELTLTLCKPCWGTWGMFCRQTWPVSSSGLRLNLEENEQSAISWFHWLAKWGKGYTPTFFYSEQTLKKREGKRKEYNNSQHGSLSFRLHNVICRWKKTQRQNSKERTLLAELPGERGWTLAQEPAEERLAHTAVLAGVVQAGGSAVPEAGERKVMSATLRQDWSTNGNSKASGFVMLKCKYSNETRNETCYIRNVVFLLR